MSNGYNGWANYETWRINMEMFDGFDASDYLDDMPEDGEYQTSTEYLANILEGIAEEIISNDVRDDQSFAYNLAMSFLNKVDFEEIADHMIEDYVGGNV